ncbi:hypothetical protein BC940DRAFT_30876 [Gongronella butleri]|nr:hypothetical protein BC940DRAFT_30876 [Gongronella butleri]
MNCLKEDVIRFYPAPFCPLLFFLFFQFYCCFPRPPPPSSPLLRVWIMAPVITEHSYWTSVLKACELSVLLLTAYKEVPLVEHTLQALQHFVRHGQTLDEAMAYKLPAPGEDRPAFSSNSSKKKRGPMAVEPLDHWDVQASHIDVPLQEQREVNSNDNNQETQRMRCHQVTTMAQVEAMKDALYASEKRIVSLDCEFLAIKKQQPQLKVVQLAASMHEGFAVLVDDFDDKDALRSALMALLEDNHFTFVGWAVRADAQAIESFIGGIQLPHILDLQAAVCRDATQRMNLKNAMLQYAKEWPFTDEFAKAKEFGDTFRYLEYDCVWDYRPFPPTALVYAVFDVTTLIALHDVFESRKIAFQETDFWPLTVTTNSSNKNLGKWIQQRAMNDVPINTNRGLIYLDSKTKPLASSATSSSNDAAESIVSTGHATDTSPREQQSDDQANDEDQFEKDIRRAILLSLQETEASSSSLTPSPKATAESYTPPAATSSDKLSNSTSNSTMKSAKSAKSTKSSKSSHFAQSGPFSTDATDTQSKSATPVPSTVLSRGMAQPKVVAEDAFTFEDLVSTTQADPRTSR